MCGRYANTRSSADLASLLEAVDETEKTLDPDYNIAPTDSVPIAHHTEQGRVLTLARWGLCPPWARAGKQSGQRYNLINARAETAGHNRAFAAAYRSGRALVPADGWYEWRRHGGKRQAYFMTPRDGSPLVFAGLWSPGPDGEPTCTVLTVAAVGELTLVHERMPLLLPAQDWDDWLSGAAGYTAAPAPAYPQLELRPIGPAVGNVRNNGPDLIKRMAGLSLDDSDGQQTATPLF